MAEIIKAENILNRARGILQDPDKIRWKDDFFLEALCDGQRDLVGLRPDANTVTVVAQLVAGRVQTLPTKSGVLIDVRCNMGVDGASPGRIIVLKAREDLNRINPSWPADDPAAEVLYFLYDKRVPLEYEVYPPQPTSSQGQVEIVHSQIPDDIAVGAFLTVGDQFAEPLLLFVLSRALSVENDATLDSARAERYRQGYIALLGAEEAAEKETEPRKKQ